MEAPSRSSQKRGAVSLLQPLLRVPSSPATRTPAAQSVQQQAREEGREAARAKTRCHSNIAAAVVTGAAYHKRARATPRRRIMMVRSNTGRHEGQKARQGARRDTVTGSPSRLHRCEECGSAAQPRDSLNTLASASTHAYTSDLATCRHTCALTQVHESTGLSKGTRRGA